MARTWVLPYGMRAVWRECEAAGKPGLDLPHGIPTAQTLYTHSAKTNQNFSECSLPASAGFLRLGALCRRHLAPQRFAAFLGPFAGRISLQRRRHQLVGLHPVALNACTVGVQRSQTVASRSVLLGRCRPQQ